MLKRLSTFAVPFALVLAVGMGGGIAQAGDRPFGPSARGGAPDASKAGPAEAPKDAPSQAEKGSSASVNNPQAGDKQGMTPLELITKMPEKGSLKNPYKDYKSVAERGHKLYMNAGFNGCHGGGGGGGMCSPLTNDIWVYGDDDTLFRLISLGSGYVRKGCENVKGPMPPHGEIVKSQDDLWKIVSWIRTVYKNDPKGQPWAQP